MTTRCRGFKRADPMDRHLEKLVALPSFLANRQRLQGWQDNVDGARNAAPVIIRFLVSCPANNLPFSEVSMAYGKARDRVLAIANAKERNTAVSH